MEDKRGTHIGVIASFSIFVLFLVSLYFVLEPATNSTREKEVVLTYLEHNVIKALQKNMTTVLVSPNVSGCMYVDFDAVGVAHGTPSIVKDSAGNLIPSFALLGLLLSIEATSEPIVWVYFSNTTFEEMLPSSSACEFTQISSVIHSQELFEEHIISEIEYFETFKQQFSTGENTDFGFSFVAQNGTVFSSSDTVPDSVGVFSKEIGINYFNARGDTRNGAIVLRTW